MPHAPLRLAPSLAAGANLAAVALLGIACLRFAYAVYQAVYVNRGDFVATLPGHYAELLNATLWDSVDLKGVRGYHYHAYIYGPAQYLTLYPMVFLDSYRQIAAVLLVFYTAVILASVYILWKTVQVVTPTERRTMSLVLISALVLLFAPLLQALTQREFDIFQFFVIVCATYLLTRNRDVSASVLLAYITWFKLWPIVALAYFVLRRRWQAVAAFTATSALVLFAADVLFDLSYFELSGGNLSELPMGYASKVTAGGAAFCETGREQTLASIRVGLCAVSAKVPWLPARGAFLVIGLVAAVAFLASFVILERHERSGGPGQRFRTLLEVSLVLMAASVSLHAHYYYLTILLLPISALLFRYLTESARTAWPKLGMLTAAYVLLAAGVVPISLLSRILRLDFWAFYTSNAVYVYGELILGGLLLWEYTAMALRSTQIADSRNLGLAMAGGGTTGRAG